MYHYVPVHKYTCTIWTLQLTNQRRIIWYQYTSIRVQFRLYNLRINDVSSSTITQVYVYNLDSTTDESKLSSCTNTQVYVYNLDSTTDESTMYHPVPVHKYTCTI